MPSTQYPIIIEPADNLREVAPHLFVGGATSVRKRAFDVVIDLHGTSRSHDPTWRAAYRRSREVVACPLEDGVSIPNTALNRVVGTIQRCPSNYDVLIHCWAGVSRSVSMAYAVLRRRGLSHAEAWERVRDPQGRTPLPLTFLSARLWADREVPCP